MKRIYLILIFFVFFEITTEVLAICPLGFSPHTFSATYIYTHPPDPVFECNVTISYCCKWDNNLKTVVVEIEEVWETTGGNCLGFIPTWVDFLQWLHTVVGNNAYLFCSPQYPPCDDPHNNYYYFQVTSSYCFYYENKLIPYQGEDVWALHLENCFGLYNLCKTTWKICFDYSTDPPTPVWTFVSKEHIGNEACETSRPTLPPRGKTCEENWATPCFETGCE